MSGYNAVLARNTENAPKGIGVLYIRKGIPVTPLTFGGSHEGGIRPGTENIPWIVALAKAVEIAGDHMAEEAERLTALRDKLEQGIEQKVPDSIINGKGASRLPACAVPDNGRMMPSISGSST